MIFQSFVEPWSTFKNDNTSKTQKSGFGYPISCTITNQTSIYCYPLAKKNKAEDNLIITPTPPLWFPRKRAKRASRKKTQSCLPKKGGDISIMVPFLLLQNIIINMHGGKKKTVIKSVNYSAFLKNL